MSDYPLLEKAQSLITQVVENIAKYDKSLAGVKKETASIRKRREELEGKSMSGITDSAEYDEVQRQIRECDERMRATESIENSTAKTLNCWVRDQMVLEAFVRMMTASIDKRYPDVMSAIVQIRGELASRLEDAAYAYREEGRP